MRTLSITKPIAKAVASKQCSCCFKTKEVTEFRPMSNVCRTCTSERSVHIATIKRAEARPHDYLMCNDCDRVFYKYALGIYYYQDKPVLTSCKFCGSEDLEDY